MTVVENVTVSHHRDFDSVYNLATPHSYYRALRPLGYRAPAFLCGFIQQNRERIAASRGKESLKVLDFCGGYGANGALLKHDLTLDELYRHYEEDNSGEDLEFFKERRRAESDHFQIVTLDTAFNAVSYAQTRGLIDSGFSDDISKSEIPGALRDFIISCDLIVETGGIGMIMTQVYRMLVTKVLLEQPKPWFLLCPRPDWDQRPLWGVLTENGYQVEAVSPLLRYRKLMESEERSAQFGVGASGRDPAVHLKDGWYQVALTLARPVEEAQALPVEELIYRED